MSTYFHLFGYGSLMATPEKSPDVFETELGRLDGYSRAFNKRSPVRGCPRSDAYDTFTDVPENFRGAHVNHSLAVGTQHCPGAVTHGVIVTYRKVLEPEILSVTDRREGYDAEVDYASLGYLRDSLQIVRPRRGDSVLAWTYLSNPGGAYHLPKHATDSLRAKILINATPMPGTATARTGRALGLLYMEQIRFALSSYGVVDEDLERMATAVHALPGPWTKLVAHPRLT